MSFFKLFAPHEQPDPKKTLQQVSFFKLFAPHEQPDPKKTLQQVSFFQLFGPHEQPQEDTSTNLFFLTFWPSRTTRP